MKSITNNLSGSQFLYKTTNNQHSASVFKFAIFNLPILCYMCKSPSCIFKGSQINFMLTSNDNFFSCIQEVILHKQRCYL